MVFLTFDLKCISVSQLFWLNSFWINILGEGNSHYKPLILHRRTPKNFKLFNFLRFLNVFLYFLSVNNLFLMLIIIAKSYTVLIKCKRIYFRQLNISCIFPDKFKTPCIFKLSIAYIKFEYLTCFCEHCNTFSKNVEN